MMPHTSFCYFDKPCMHTAMWPQIKVQGSYAALVEQGLDIEELAHLHDKVRGDEPWCYLRIVDAVFVYHIQATRW